MAGWGWELDRREVGEKARLVLVGEGEGRMRFDDSFWRLLNV